MAKHMIIAGSRNDVGSSAALQIIEEISENNPCIRYIDLCHIVPDDSVVTICGSKIPNKIWGGSKFVWIIPQHHEARMFLPENVKSHKCVVALRNPEHRRFKCAVIRTIRNLDILWTSGRAPFESSSTNSRCSHAFLSTPPLANDGFPELESSVSIHTITPLINIIGLQALTEVDLIQI